MRRFWSGLLIGAGGFLGVAPSALAGTCALCRQALTSGGNQGLIQGFYWSILLIAGIPLVIMGTVGLLVWRSARLKRRIEQPGHSPSHATP
jgi:hypothetical protein